jgi:hypothetical protein
MSHVTMPATMVRCFKSLADFTKCDTRKSSHGSNGKSSTLTHFGYTCVAAYGRAYFSCLAHVINLGSQALISTHSKSPHYNPREPKAHEPDVFSRGDRDEVGLVRTICVKVYSMVPEIEPH